MFQLSTDARNFLKVGYNNLFGAEMLEFSKIFQIPNFRNPEVWNSNTDF